MHRPSGHRGDRYVRVLSTTLAAADARSLRVSLFSRHGIHRRMPLLMGSTIDGVAIMYWRKTFVSGAVHGDVRLHLRVPRRVLDDSVLRVRVVDDTGIRTTYLRVPRA
jgi:hypothetical protein